MTVLPDDPASLSPQEMRRLQQELQRFMLGYEFGLREIETKISILSDEFRHMHDYNPIEHVSSRVKSAESLLAKITRKGLPRDLDAIREHVRDVAGVRVTCSFVADAYRIFDLLTQQEDVSVIEVKDYIKAPKPNGYKSLHAIVEVPVFLSTGRQDVPVEVQLRTIAMDFWASLEHKIHYKYDGRVPADLVDQLREAAETAQALDSRMQGLHQELHGR
jgi:putative GTP pyrophosphokinase